ncbi:hypothetical protein D3C86_2186110 [compost metagenome]
MLHTMREKLCIAFLIKYKFEKRYRQEQNLNLLLCNKSGQLLYAALRIIIDQT